MLNGAQLAIDEANARGGYGGKPFKLKVHNDGGAVGRLEQRDRQDGL
jgi:ABC-type branched-subunit amino acid transport system substrate-binding protein